MDLKWAGFALGAGALACGAIGAALAGPAAAQVIFGGAATASQQQPATAAPLAVVAAGFAPILADRHAMIQTDKALTAQ